MDIQLGVLPHSLPWLFLGNETRERLILNLRALLLDCLSFQLFQLINSSIVAEMAPIMPFGEMNPSSSAAAVANSLKVVNQIGDAWNAPVKGPGIAFAILFAITGVWHVFQNLYVIIKSDWECLLNLLQ